MKTIWKFPLKITETQFVKMPREARIIAVGVQGVSQPVLWAEVETWAPVVNRMITTIGTGQEVSDLDKMIYVGTYQIFDFVGHVYEG